MRILDEYIRLQFDNEIPVIKYKEFELDFLVCLYRLPRRLNYQVWCRITNSDYHVIYSSWPKGAYCYE